VIVSVFVLTVMMAAVLSGSAVFLVGVSVSRRRILDRRGFLIIRFRRMFAVFFVFHKRATERFHPSYKLSEFVRVPAALRSERRYG
jgi:hypothetical protein